MERSDKIDRVFGVVAGGFWIYILVLVIVEFWG